MSSTPPFRPVEMPSGAVFLSYASQDAEAAKRICEALRAAGVEVWFDQSELRGGDAWDANIRRQIKDCALFVPVISRHTQERVEGYFRREWRLAVERTHDMADDAAFFVPVVVDDTPEAQARVPDRFRERQWTHLPGGETPPAFCERLRHLLAGPAGAAAPAGDVRVPEPREVPGWRPAIGGAVPDTPWVLEAKLGEGGFGEVWLGRHPKMNERRVFKFCFRADRVRSLKRELTLFRVVKERVGGHPNIVRLLGVHFDEPPYYVEMDYVEGQSLKVWCDEQGGVDKVPLATRLEIVAQIADALHAAHTAGVLHRDVKPGNILIAQPATGAPPVAKVSDFGIGQVTSAEVLEGVTKAGFTQSIVADVSPQSGTQLYMAPELLAGERATAQSDIYSLGVVLYQLLVGDMRRPLTTDWPRAIEDPCLRADLERCFAGRSEERFESADLLARNLRALPARRAALAEQQAVAAARRRTARRWRLLRAAGVAALVVGLGAGLIWFLQRNAKMRWARETALPQIGRLVADRDYTAAFALATQVEKYLPADPELVNLWPKISARMTIETIPEGADIYFKEYQRPDSAWRYLGRSPLKDIRLANVTYRWRFQKDGYVTREVAWGFFQGSRLPLILHLARPDEIPAGMVRVEASPFPPVPGALLGLEATVKLADYLIDQFEVSNRQFREFVARGGYTDRAYWKQPFIRQGREAAWEEVMAGFRDTTGQPGPATWANGTYPDGMADYPVTGVSWYEAAAYAEFVGKRLPSVYHWRFATFVAGSDTIVALSNFAGRGLAPVGQYIGMSWCGAYDLAGNAREWCWNEAGPEQRYIFGGGWSEPTYAFTLNNAASPFDRSALNGFRCMKLLSSEALDAHVDEPIVPWIRDYSKETPVSDEVFRVLRQQFSYQKAPLEARIEERVDDGSSVWRCEKISFNAAYGNERVTAFLFLPKRAVPPFQAVVYSPGADAFLSKVNASAGRLLPGERCRFIVEAGRAVVFPIYKGTFERGKGRWPDTDQGGYRDWIIQLSKDLARTIDYLETRPDIRSDKLAYVGFSMGGVWGPIFSALESRLKANVFLDGGLDNWNPLPDADPFNYAPRVTTPTLMVNGSADFRLPLETSQRPLFQTLGTPPEHKRHLLVDAGHAAPEFLYAQEVVAWLDRYLGPVK